MERGRHDHLDEQVVQRFGQPGIDHGVEGDDRAERRQPVAGDGRAAASSAVRPTAMPQGVVCLMTAQAGRFGHAPPR